MIVWNKHLYVGPEAGRKKHRYQKDVENGRFRPGLYVITPAASGQDLMDILPACELLQPYYQGREIQIWGLGLGRGESLALVETMIMDCYRETGDFQVAAWLQAGGTYGLG